MSDIIFKTRPRLFLLSAYFIGSIFCDLLFLLVWQTGKLDLVTIPFLVLFATGSLTLLFYFLKTRTIRLQEEKLIVSYFILPIKKEFSLENIRGISQKAKKVEGMVGPTSFSKSYIYTDIITTLTLSDKTEIKLNSVGGADFGELEDLFFKLKRREGKIKIPQRKKRILLYVLDNIDGIIWVILLFVVTIGLTYGLLTR